MTCRYAQGTWAWGSHFQSSASLVSGIFETRVFYDIRLDISHSSFWRLIIDCGCETRSCGIVGDCDQPAGCRHSWLGQSWFGPEEEDPES